MPFTSVLITDLKMWSFSAFPQAEEFLTCVCTPVDLEVSGGAMIVHCYYGAKLVGLAYTNRLVCLPVWVLQSSNVLWAHWYACISFVLLED